MKTRLALREIVHSWRFSIAFVLNLALGLLGFVLLSGFNQSLQETFQSRSRALLTADLAISARRELAPSELRMVDEAFRERGYADPISTRTLELYSMIAVQKPGSPQSATRLAEIIAIEKPFPLYGEIQLERTGAIRGETEKPLVSSPLAWISPELSIQMGLKRGDPIQIGRARFEVADVVQQDIGSGARGFSLAPRVYVGASQLEATGLVQKGSTLRVRRFYKLGTQERPAPEADLEKIASDLDHKLVDPGVQIVTHRQAGEQTARSLAYLADYLGLVALVGLFLASLGSAYLFQSYLSRRLSEIATLVSLGLPHSGAIVVYLIQVGLLGALSVALASGAAALTLPSIGTIVARYTPFALELKLRLNDLATALAVGIAGSTLICLPLLLKIRQLKPSILFQESAQPSLHWDRRSALAYLPALAFFYALSVWQAHSWRVGSLFFGALIASGVALALIAYAVLGLVRRLGRAAPIQYKLPLRYLSRNPLSTISAFVAVGLGALLINLLPQLQRNIESEIASPEASKVPSLFLFDIQEEQTEGLQKLFHEEGVKTTQLAPMVRARLESINGKPFLKAIDVNERSTREEEEEARSRNRGFNLTFRDQLNESESIVEGREFSARAAGQQAPSEAPEHPPELSIEYRFAERIGAKLGDVLEFDVQGVPVKGKVVNLRKVKWTSFQPNFFVLFQPGVLEDAPKTYLTSVEKLALQERVRLQNRIVRELPNVSIIDVTQLISRILEMFTQMAWALKGMAYLAVLTGLVVLFSIASHQASTRKREAQLLKVLGGDTPLVSRMYLIEFGAIGLSASLLGVLLSTGVSYGISSVLFDSAWSFALALPVLTVAAITLLTLLTTYLAVRRVLREKPGAILAGEVR